jgi:hypothetical protein
MMQTFVMQKRTGEQECMALPRCTSAPLRAAFRTQLIVVLLVAWFNATARAQEQSSAASLSNVHAAMIQAQQRLAAGDTGALAQERQQTAAEMLAALVEAAKAREASSQMSSGGGQSQQQSPSNQSASQEPSQSTPGDQPGTGSKPDGQAASTRASRPAPQSPWSKLRDRERDPVYSAIKERFPARYQQLLEQYYKSFQDAPQR